MSWLGWSRWAWEFACLSLCIVWGSHQYTSDPEMPFPVQKCLNLLTLIFFYRGMFLSLGTGRGWASEMCVNETKLLEVLQAEKQLKDSFNKYTIVMLWEGLTCSANQNVGLNCTAKCWRFLSKAFWRKALPRQTFWWKWGSSGNNNSRKTKARNQKTQKENFTEPSPKKKNSWARVFSDITFFKINK